MTLDLLTRARGGDDAAFQALTEPHRRELLAHCYRMLGSFQDAEDALQDVLLTAWRGIGGFEGRASLRTWLYRIATNRCLNMRRDASRRPAAGDVPGLTPPEPTRHGEVVWLQPFPDALMEGLAELPVGPEARYEQRESMSLAFVTALQVLPPRQLAVLVLRDVLGFSAAEVAEMLEVSLDAANSALKRARSGLAPRPLPSAPAAAADDALVARFVAAYEAADIDAVVSLLTDDIFMAMPPMDLEYLGRDAVREFLMSLFASGRHHSLIPTRANGQPAFGAYLLGPDGLRHASGLFTLELRDGAIGTLMRFESTVLPWFGLPRTLPAG